MTREEILSRLDGENEQEALVELFFMFFRELNDIHVALNTIASILEKKL